MEIAIENNIAKFLRTMKWLNPTAISLSFIDLLLGLLSISFVDLSAIAVISSLTSVSIIVAIYIKFKNLKKQAEKLGIYAEQLLKYTNFYNLSSIIWGLLDVLFGGLAIVATSLVFLSTISSAFKCKILTLGKIGGKVINLQKVQSTFQTINSNSKFKKLLQVLGFGGIIYIINRGKKFLLKEKIFMSKIFKFIWANKMTILDMAIGGVSGYFGAYHLVLSYLIVPVWALYTISGVSALLLAILAIYLGGETIAAYVKRIAVSKLSIEDKEKVSLAIDETLKKVEIAKAEAAKLDEAIAKAKAELAAKQEAEAVALAKANLAKENSIPQA